METRIGDRIVRDGIVGTVLRVTGNTAYVWYDDGRREWTII